VPGAVAMPVRTLWVERFGYMDSNSIRADDARRRYKAVKTQNMLLPETYLSPDDVQALIDDGVTVNIDWGEEK
jgi:hypothetical protein